MSSLSSIYKALLTRLDAITAPLPTQYENEAFTPPATAYQSVNLLTAEPGNPTMGGTPVGELYREQGVFQVTLFYPLNEGAGNALTRAEALRDWFSRGSSFTDSGITVSVGGTPRIGPGMRDDDRYVLPVDIPFFSNVYA